MTTFLELVTKANEIQKQLSSEGETLLLNEVTAFMEKHPEVMVVYFYQYTPSFNDGDPCTNSLVGPGVLLASDFSSDPITSVTQERFREVKGDFDECGHNYDLEDTALCEWLDTLASPRILERIYGTNTEVAFVRTAEGVTCTVDSYDCGY